MISRLFQFGLLVAVLSCHVLATVPRLTTLNVKCDKNGMNVHLEFDFPFNGVVYSKGHYNNPSCRYIIPGSDSKVYNFQIPLSGCGTTRDNSRAVDTEFSLSNIIIFQNDESLQEVWDRAQSLRCQWTDNIDKFVNFQPIGVDTLDIQELTFSGDQVDCWMEVQIGKGPFSTPVNRLVKIGETLTLAVFIKDETRQFDVTVKTCYAFDSPDFNSPETRRIQLTDSDGCPIKKKVIEGFYRTRQSGNTGASVIAYAYVSAFKFPDKTEVYMACNVNICKRGCYSQCLQDTNGVESQNIINVVPNATSTKFVPVKPVERRNQVAVGFRPYRPKNLTNGHVDRVKRDTEFVETNMQRSFSIYSPDDLPPLDPVYLYQRYYDLEHDVCMSIHSFAMSAAVTVLLLLLCSYLVFLTCCRLRHNELSTQSTCRYYCFPCLPTKGELMNE